MGWPSLPTGDLGSQLWYYYYNCNIYWLSFQNKNLKDRINKKNQGLSSNIFND